MSARRHSDFVVFADARMTLHGFGVTMRPFNERRQREALDRHAVTKNAYIETYGCQMNVHDSERAASLLSAIHYQMVDSPEEADLILLNTCAVREKASAKVFARAAQLKSIHPPEARKQAVIGVIGCVAQSEAESIFEKAPEVKIVLGPSSLPSLPNLVRQIEDGFPRAIDIRKDSSPDFFEISATERKVKHLAYITIIEGCDKVCSYCIVPYTRGRERSRPVESILAEAQSLAAEGFKEIQLLGQNVNSYRGRHLADGGGICSFPRLLELLASECGVPRIKFTTSHPIDFSEEIIRVMDEHPHLCNWIHLPVQSGSTRVLQAMRRDYTRDDYLRRIDFIRRAGRHYAITTDLIVGFPGESEQDFKETLSLVEDVGFDGAYMFKYSPRPHSSANQQADDVPAEVKQERLERLQEVQYRVQNYCYKNYIGQIVNVLVEFGVIKNNGNLSGHSSCNKVVHFNGMPELIGQIVDVRVTEARKNSLYGNLE